MIEALRSLGTQIDELSNGDLQVLPKPFDRAAQIDCGLAGTVMRFVPPISVLAKAEIRFDGDEAARRRPMKTREPCRSPCWATAQ
jgi:3-phosphoshikimate 1-carboxyvinyltransferase